MSGFEEIRRRGPRGALELAALAAWGRRDWVILARWLDDCTLPSSQPTLAGIALRPMADDDVDAVAALLPWRLTHQSPRLRRAWVADMLASGHPPFVACLRDTPIAAVWLPPPTPDNVHRLDQAAGAGSAGHFRQVVKLVTSPPCRGAGVAGGLLAFAMAALAPQGVRGLVSVIAESNVPSLKVHQRLGFGLLQVHRARWRLGLRHDVVDTHSPICSQLGFEPWMPVGPAAQTARPRQADALPTVQGNWNSLRQLVLAVGVVVGDVLGEPALAAILP